MKVLVTGSTGYIGSHTVLRLSKRGDTVIALDRVPPVGPLPNGVIPVVADVRDRARVGSLMREHSIEAVIHLAALKKVGESLIEPTAYFDVNVGGTIAVAEGAIKSGVDVLVLSSSCAVYGAPLQLPVSESTTVQPASPYGATKAMSEEILAWLDRMKLLRSVSLRYFNVAGVAEGCSLGPPGSTPEDVISVAISCALRATAMPVFGSDYPTPDGTAVRDYVHVLDIADAHIGALDYLARGGTSQTLNVGTGQGVSVLEVVDAVRRASGRNIVLETAQRRRGDVGSIWADVSNAELVLGWKAAFDLDDMVSSAWEWRRRRDDEAA